MGIASESEQMEQGIIADHSKDERVIEAKVLNISKNRDVLRNLHDLFNDTKGLSST